MRVPSVTALVVAVLVLGGCGGSGTSSTTTSSVSTTTVSTTPTSTSTTIVTTPAAKRYDAAMRRLGNSLGRAVDGLYPLDTGTPGSAQSKHTITKLEEAQATVESVDRSLASIEPPAAVVSQHRALRKAVARVGVQLGKLAASLRTGDTQTFNRLSQLPALAGVTAATDAIEKKGYDVLGSNG